jgi:hypothetical protein
MSGGVLLLSWLLSVGSLNLQQAVQQGGTLAGYQSPANTFSTTLGVEALVLSYVFISASVTTYETWRSGFSFAPSQSLYTFSAGARTHGVEIGIRHECDHITLSSFDGIPNAFMANRTEVYVSVSGSFSPF